MAEALDAPQVTDEFLTLCDNPGAPGPALPHVCFMPFNCSTDDATHTYIRVCAGAPPHVLKLSVGSVAMITRNMEGKFKNGRRVVVRNIYRRTVVVADADAYILSLIHISEPTRPY